MHYIFLIMCHSICIVKDLYLVIRMMYYCSEYRVFILAHVQDYYVFPSPHSISYFFRFFRGRGLLSATPFLRLTFLFWEICTHIANDIKPILIIGAIEYVSSRSLLGYGRSPLFLFFFKEDY